MNRIIVSLILTMAIASCRPCNASWNERSNEKPYRVWYGKSFEAADSLTRRLDSTRAAFCTNYKTLLKIDGLSVSEEAFLAGDLKETTELSGMYAFNLGDTGLARCVHSVTLYLLTNVPVVVNGAELLEPPSSTLLGKIDSVRVVSVERKRRFPIFGKSYLNIETR